jgi:hypothetical protein
VLRLSYRLPSTGASDATSFDGKSLCVGLTGMLDFPPAGNTRRGHTRSTQRSPQPQSAYSLMEPWFALLRVAPIERAHPRTDRRMTP